MRLNPRHEHTHDHHGKTAGRILWLATGLTLAYAGVEAGVGWWAGSLALWPTPGMSMDKLTEAETTSLFNAARIVARRMMTVFQPEMVTVYARGRRIPHTHLFLVPTHSGDPLDRFFNALEKFQEMPPELTRLREPAAMAETARRLRENE